MDPSPPSPPPLSSSSSAFSGANVKNRVKQRIAVVIAGATETEKKAVRKEIVRIKDFICEYDLDSNLVLHLCRSLAESVAQDLSQDIDVTLCLNVIRTILNLIPTCEKLNDPIAASGVDNNQLISLYDWVVPHIAAVLLRVPIPRFKQTEQLLLYYLLDEDMARVLIISDVWCIISRAAENTQFAHTEFLFQMAMSFPLHDFRRTNIHCLLRRMMRFSDDDCRAVLVNKFDPSANGFHFALEYLTDEKKDKDLKLLTERIFASGSCFLSHVESVCHLLVLMPSRDPQLLHSIKELVASFRCDGLDPLVAARVSECKHLLSSL